LARQAGYDQIVTFDMGGTSTDVSLCPGRVQQTSEGTVAGLPLRLPIIDIHTVGAGGGSMARLDAGGALRVGPESAGSDPGPICYGLDKAQSITVTDANLILGRLDPDHFLGGRMKLHVPPTTKLMRTLGEQLSLPSEAAAWGVIRVANSNMERAIRTVSIERGFDPRLFTLVAFGGAGPLHACELARALAIPRVLVPPQPGVLSALGMLLSDVVKDYSRTIMLPVQETDAETLLGLFAPLFDRAASELQEEGLSTEQITLRPALDMRYVGQGYELAVDLSDWITPSQVRGSGQVPNGDSDHRVQSAPPENAGSVEAALAEAFHAAHLQRFSYATFGEPIEIVNLRVKAVGSTRKPKFHYQAPGDVNPRPAHIGYKQVHLSDADAPDASRPILAALYQRDKLLPGNIVVGPAIIFQPDSTTLIPPDWFALVDGWRNLVLQQGTA
jgi:N-methylhydantoinase A